MLVSGKKLKSDFCRKHSNRLLGLLKKADKTFECVRENGYRVLNSPKLDAIAIDEDGWPAPIRVPDPRAFALHKKVWLSGLYTREPIKKPRDLDQARTVAKLVQDEMPQMTFESALTSLHGDVRNMLPKLGLNPTPK